MAHAWRGSTRLPLGSRLRANLTGSYEQVTDEGSLAASNHSGLNKRAWSVAANLFYTPVDNVDVGLEYRHGAYAVLISAVVGGEATGYLDRVEFAAKYSF